MCDRLEWLYIYQFEDVGDYPAQTEDVSLSTQPAELLKMRCDFISTVMTGVRGVARLSFNFVLVLSSGQTAERRLQSLTAQLT